MTDYSIRSNEEAKTLELLATYRNKDETYTAGHAVKQAVRAMWVSCFTVAHLTKVASAMCACDFVDEASVQSVVTRMVRQGILRKNKSVKSMYEVNY